MAIAAVRVQVPSRVRIRRKASANSTGFFVSRSEPSLLVRRMRKQKNHARTAGRLFVFQHVRSGLTEQSEVIPVPEG